MTRRVLSIALSLFLLAGMASSAAALPRGGQTDEAGQASMSGRISDPSIRENLTSRFEGNTDALNEEVRVIIELVDEPLLATAAYSAMSDEAAASARDRLVSKHGKVQSDIKKINSKVQFRHSYSNTLNGFSATVKVSDINTIKELPEVKNVYIVQKYSLPTPQDASSLKMVNGFNAWNTNGFTGKGYKVAVLDTGIDYTHELLSEEELYDGSYTYETVEDLFIANIDSLNVPNYAETSDLYKNSKVVFGYDYADADFDPMDDKAGHGTHVAGIVGANAMEDGVAMGVAPDVQLFAMKVFSSFDEYAYDHDVLAAIEDAITMGADAMNLSLGSPAGFTSYEGIGRFFYTEVFALAKASGISVACSAGNEYRVGEEGGFLGNAYPYPYTSNPDAGLVGSPGTEADAMATASVDNEYAFSAYFTVSTDADAKFSFTDTNPTPISTTFNGQSYQYAYCGIGGPGDFDGVDVAGKIALISRGTHSFVDKVTNAYAAGAVGAVVYNYANFATLNMAIDGVEIPAVFISYEDGMSLLDALAADPEAELSFSTDYTSLFDNPTAWQMSDFSAWGVTPDLKLKPNITAPGGSIYSTMPVTMGSYGEMGGTSMASPHVAGAFTLVKEYISKIWPDLEPIEVSTLADQLAASTATLLYDPEGIPYSPRRQGAGMLDVFGATSSDVVVYNGYDGKTKVELGDGLENEFVVEFLIDNKNADSERKYKLLASAMTDDYWYINEEFSFTWDAEYIFSTAVITLESAEDCEITGDTSNLNAYGDYTDAYVTVPAGTLATVKLRVAVDPEDFNDFASVFTNGFFLEGFVELISQQETQPNLSVPYVGFAGDWLSAPAFDAGSVYEDHDFEGIPYYWGNAMITKIGDDDDGDDIDDNDYFYMGVNVYDDEDIAPWRLRYNAFSPDGDGFWDTAGALMYLLRNLKTMWVTIEDAGGNVIRTINAIEDYYPKSYVGSSGLSSTLLHQAGLEWDGMDDDNNPAENGTYTYTIHGMLDYPGAENRVQTWSIPVILDTVAPTISYSFRQERGRVYLDVTTIDTGSTTCGVFLYNSSGIQSLYGYWIAAEEEFSVTFDVTAQAGRQLRIYADDYALNESGVLTTRVPQPQPPAKMDVSVTTPTIVATLAANLHITAKGGDFDGEELYAYLDVDGDPKHETALDANGKGIMRIDAAPGAEKYSLVIKSADGLDAGSCEITVVAYDPASLWEPGVTFDYDTGDTLIQFSETIGHKTGGKIAVTVGGKANTYDVTDENGLLLTGCNYDDLSTEDAIVVSGLKYPILFPSYSFTFTLYKKP